MVVFSTIDRPSTFVCDRSHGFEGAGHDRHGRVSRRTRPLGVTPAGLGTGPGGVRVAAVRALQLRPGLVRSARRLARAPGPGRPDHPRGGRLAPDPHVRAAEPGLQQGRELAARARCASRGSRDPDAQQPGGAVGVHARVHQVGGGGDPHDHPDGTHGPHGPGGTRRGLVGGGRRGGRRQVRVGARGLHGRVRPGRPCGFRSRGGTRTPRPHAPGLPGGPCELGRTGAGEPHGRGRHPAAVLHVRDHVQAQTRGAHPHVLPRGPPLHDVLDRSGTR